ncbi:MAG TPA: DUF4328 domain-containing protein [Candidatus Dormibacteraeota bacterium]|nr:DUF4328 domain-containing protein [Candidatus Dormibacteraeota bacterium]
MQQTGQISPDGYWMWDGTQWVPNPYRPAAAPPMAAPYESAASRAGIASILLYANIAGIVCLIVDGLLIDLMSNPNDTQSLVIGLWSLVTLVVWLGTQIAAIVFFCMWLHRVVRNMPSLGAPDPRWSPARAVVFCFIPILNWFHPLWSTLDAWRGADASRRWLDLPSRRQLRPPTLIGYWWAAWLGGSLVLNIGSRLSGPIAAVFDVAGGAVQIVAAVLCVMVIREVTARQERKNRLIASGQLV